MANKPADKPKEEQKLPAAKEPATKTTEAWCKEKGVSPSAYAGMMAFYDWAEGREMTETEFDQALKRYLKAPISRPRA